MYTDKGMSTRLCVQRKVGLSLHKQSARRDRHRGRVI